MWKKPKKNQPAENGPENNGPGGGKPEKKKLSFRQRLKEAFNGVSRKELRAIFRDTLKDLRRPQEIALLVGSSFIPGGWIGYGVYRVAKYRHKKAANDNPEQPPEEPKPPGPKPPSP